MLPNWKKPHVRLTVQSLLAFLFLLIGTSRSKEGGCSAGLTKTRYAISSIQSETIMQKSCRAFSSGDGDLVDVVVPFMGESITDGTLATFLKKPGDRVAADEPIAQIETDKVTIDVVSPQDGVIQEYVAKEGDTVEPGVIIAVISKSAEGVAPAEKKSEKAASKPSPPAEAVKENEPKAKVEASLAVEKPKAPAPPPPKRTATEPVLPPKERERRIKEECDSCFYVKLFGLVVPVVRDADKMNFAEIEQRRQLMGPYQLMKWLEAHLQYPTVVFYGSLLSTPIINPPQVSGYKQNMYTLAHACKGVPYGCDLLVLLLTRKRTLYSLGYRSGFYVTQMFSSNKNGSLSSTVPSKHYAIPNWPQPPSVFGWNQRPLPPAALMVASPHYQNPARLRFPQAKDETNMFEGKKSNQNSNAEPYRVLELG
ncbi:hypothetical protein V6N11_038557 [Hibiscus sabdariffa]|uniref:Lipoyl-binding domain-containing protein n=1 Tax=Hibiscus sabdariffa TaxID=183260 RepID=A0ABR2SLA1_9ROSI